MAGNDAQAFIQETHRYLVLTCEGQMMHGTQTLDQAEGLAAKLACSMVLEMGDLRKYNGAAEPAEAPEPPPPAAEIETEPLQSEPEPQQPFDLNLKEGETAHALVTLEDCNACDEVKESLKDELESGEILEIKAGYSTEEKVANFNLLNEQQLVQGYPSLVEVTRENDEIKIAEMSV